MKNQIVTTLLLIFLSLSVYSQNKDQAIFLRKSQITLAATPSESILNIAKSFIGTPYEASTLEINETEQLVCNLQELDCFTFTENVLALYLTKKENSNDFEDYKRFLTQLRYRNNQIDGYSSRLHYFIEWARQAESNKWIKDITLAIGGKTMNKTISFMSENKNLYPKISDNKTLEKIIENEKDINKKPLYHIEKSKIFSIESKIKEGDLIAISSIIPGLDCNHVGFAILLNGRIHLLHASSTLKKVVISKKPLAEYVHDFKKNTGIIVFQVL